MYTDSWDLLSLLLVENPTGRIPTRQHGVSINVTKDSESANVTVKLKVKLSTIITLDELTFTD